MKYIIGCQKLPGSSYSKLRWNNKIAYSSWCVGLSAYIPVDQKRVNRFAVYSTLLFSNILNWQRENQCTARNMHTVTYLLTHGAEPFLRNCQLCSHSRTSQRFMEPEDSLPPSQEPFTGPYPEPDRSNPHHPILSL
jgi:hypothetical protein